MVMHMQFYSGNNRCSGIEDKVVGLTFVSEVNVRGCSLSLRSANVVFGINDAIRPIKSLFMYPG